MSRDGVRKGQLSKSSSHPFDKWLAEAKQLLRGWKFSGSDREDPCLRKQTWASLASLASRGGTEHRPSFRLICQASQCKPN